MPGVWPAAEGIRVDCSDHLPRLAGEVRLEQGAKGRHEWLVNWNESERWVVGGNFSPGGVGGKKAGVEVKDRGNGAERSDHFNCVFRRHRFASASIGRVYGSLDGMSDHGGVAGSVQVRSGLGWAWNWWGGCGGGHQARAAQ